MSFTAFRRSLVALTAVALAFFAATTNAYTISVTGGSSGGNPGGQPLYEVSGLVQGDAFNVAWGGVSGVSATGMVSIESLTASTADIRVMLDNLSTPISNDDPRVTSFGLNIGGYTSLASTLTGGTDLDLADDGNFPGFGAIDACATSGNNCAGGGSGGIPAGSSDDFTLQLNGNFGSTLTLSDFGLKVQGGPGGASFELAGVPSPEAPEPTSLVLFVVAVAGLAIYHRT